MADIDKLLVCFTQRSREKHEVVDTKERLIELFETPDLDIDVCFTCTEVKDEDFDSMVLQYKQDLENKEFDEEKAAAKVMYDELKAKYDFE